MFAGLISIYFPVQGTNIHGKPANYSSLTYEQAVDTMKQYEFHSSDEDVARPKSPVSFESFAFVAMASLRKCVLVF